MKERASVAEVIRSRLPGSAGLVKTLLDGRTTHCFRAGRSVSVAGFSVSAGHVNGECVAAAVYRHVATQPSSGRTRRAVAYTELILIAVVEKDQSGAKVAGRGFGKTLLAHVFRQSKSVGSDMFYVCAQPENPFWKSPSLGLPQLPPPKEHLFTPWNLQSGATPKGVVFVGRKANPSVTVGVHLGLVSMRLLLLLGVRGSCFSHRRLRRQGARSGQQGCRGQAQPSGLGRRRSWWRRSW